MVCLECAFSHTCPCNTHTHTHPQQGPSGTPRKTGCSGPAGGGKSGRAGELEPEVWTGTPRQVQASRPQAGTRRSVSHVSQRQVWPTRNAAPHPGLSRSTRAPTRRPTPPPRALPERVGAHAEAHSNLIHHRPHLDSPQAPRQASVVYPRSGILLDNEKGRATDTRTGSEESPRHHAARKKPGAGENVSHGSTHTEFKSRRRGRERTSRGDGNGLRLDPGGGGGGGLST